MSTPTRRHFLLAGAALPVLAGASAAHAAAAPATLDVSQSDAFTAASTRYAVPVAVLAATSYAQSRWIDHADRPSAGAGYGPMHLIDGAAAQAARERIGKPDAPAALATLADAAAASGLSVAELKSDPAANIMGAAALLATHQGAAGLPLGVNTDPASWYAAIADISGLTSAAAQLDFADAVMTHTKNGVSTTLSDGSTLRLPGRAVGGTNGQRDAIVKRASEAAKVNGQPAPIDAPMGLAVDWIEAPYEKYGPGPGDYGNHDLANRPVSPSIDYIVIHDTECSYDLAIQLATDATYLAWNYMIRSSDGHIAQHLHPKDIGWHAGNWYINTHSIGIEHEGYMAKGSAWYSEPMYENSARLVRYLCDKYQIPKDRAHIIGHDQVPGIDTAHIRGMHVDPGPYWDWEHYFELLGAPLTRGSTGGPRRQGLIEQVVRIVPDFATNFPPITGCDVRGVACATLPANFVYVHIQPDAAAPLVKDLGRYANGQPCTQDASDMGARATAGAEYVTIERRGDWLSIWYLGQQGWIHDPEDSPRTRLVASASVVTAKADVTAKTYGRCYPEAAAYPAGIPVQTVSPLVYTFAGPQKYVVTDASPVTDYYRANTFDTPPPADHIDIVGQDRYIQVSLGQRVSFVRAADVVVSELNR